MKKKSLCCGQEVTTHLAEAKSIREAWRNRENNESNNTLCQYTSREIYIFQNILLRKYFTCRPFCKTLGNICPSGKIMLIINILKVLGNPIVKISFLKIHI